MSKLQFGHFVETSNEWLERSRFEEQMMGSIVAVGREFVSHSDVETIVSGLISALDKDFRTEFRTITGGVTIITAYLDNEHHVPRLRAMIVIKGGDNRPRPRGRGFGPQNGHHLTIEGSACIASSAQVRRAIESLVEAERLAEVTWWYKRGDGRCDAHVIIMPPPPQPLDAFYPFLHGESVAGYLDRYMKSSAAILFMIGPPGTGKTSLLRWMLHRGALKAYLTYDDSLLSSDEMFVTFMTSEAEVVIVEDADTMLGSREHESNAVIARFLGVSDGIVKLPEKKLIFTCNLPSTADIDPALLRPGRCFDVLRFRALTGDEATIAARVAGVRDPGHGVTLAELFNPERDDEMTPERRIGF